MTRPRLLIQTIAGGALVATTLALGVSASASDRPSSPASDGASPVGAIAPPSGGGDWRPGPRESWLPVVGAPPTSQPDVGTARLAARPRLDSKQANRARALGATRCGRRSLCGQFEVPLDRDHPKAGTALIDFTLLVHSAPAPSKSALWWNGGGPGPSTTRNEPWIPDYLFAGLQHRHDVLLTDVRGTGSTAPKCPTLQHFEGYYPGEANHQPIADCAASIADRIDAYGSADSARDLNALRRALRIPTLNIVGNSYGSIPATAFAIRFPKHTRSLIISSGVDAEATLASEMSLTATGTSRILDLLCRRSPACSAGVPDARTALAAGVQQLRDEPLEGDSTGPNSTTPIHVRLTEGMLFTILQESDGNFLAAAGEVPAAMISLGQGDPAPALRLGADMTYSLTPQGPFPPAKVDSWGGHFAIECSDYRLPWPHGLELDARIPAAVNSVESLDMAPWSAAAVAGTPEYYDAEQVIDCNRWPDVNAEPVIPTYAGYPKVPTLVMASTFDTRVVKEFGERQVQRWPNSQLVNIGGALHGAALWACGPSRVRAFIREPGSHQDRCDPARFPAYRAVGEFPVVGADARPLAVNPEGTNETTVADRRLAAVALETALDANSVSNRQYDLGVAPGLRGGSANVWQDDTHLQIDLMDDRYASDVAVNGALVYPWDGSTPTIDITFESDSGVKGHLKVKGEWNAGRSAAAPGLLAVRGQIDGRRVALLLPL